MPTIVPNVSGKRMGFFGLDASSAPSLKWFSWLIFPLVLGYYWEWSYLVYSFILKQGVILLNFVALIQRLHGATEVGQFRPIVVVNFLFKIIHKILADRLSLIMSNLASPQRVAFVKGRHIQCSTCMVLEDIILLDRKSFGRNLGLNIDTPRL